MSGPKNVRCRNFNDEGVGACDSGEYCHFVHPGPRWAGARPYNRNPYDLQHIPPSYRDGGSRGRPGGGGGGGRAPRRCRHYEPDGSPIKGGCFSHPNGECRFVHPDQPGWDTATPPDSSFSRSRGSFGLSTGSNSLPSGSGRKDSTSSFGRASMDTTADTGSGFGFGASETHQSPEPITPSIGWGQSNTNESQRSTEGTSGGGGWGSAWGAENASHGWGADETSNTNTGWGAGDSDNTNTGWGGGGSSSGGWGSGGGWGSSGNTSNSGGGGWGSSSKNDNAVDKTKPTTQKTVDTNPPVQASSDSAWGSSSTVWGSSKNATDSSATGWGSSGNDWGSSSTVSGSGGGWGSSSKNDDTADKIRPTRQKATDTNPPVQASSDNAWGSSKNTTESSATGWGSSGNGWGSSSNVSGSGGGGWGSSSKNADTVDTNPPVQASSDNTWGSSSTTRGSSKNTLDSSATGWGSSGNAWGSSGWSSSNSTWGSSNETARDESTGPGKGKGKERMNSTHSGSWSNWREASNSETTAGLPPSGGTGWGMTTPSVPAATGVTQGSIPTTTRPDTAPAAMDVDEGEPHFEGKTILTALEKAVQKRRNKRKRSHEDITQSPRYYRHLVTSPSMTGSRVDGDGDAVMGGMTNQPAREDSLEAGEIVEVPPCTTYDMNVLSHEPKTSEEKTTFAKHLLHIFTEAAVAVDRSQKEEKRYEDYKKSQEARMYNHPGHDARLVLVQKLQALRTSSHRESERLARIVTDLESLPSHNLFDVVAYNEHNHLTAEGEAEEKRKASMDEVVKRWNEKHDLIDRNLLVLQSRLDELAQEKQAREAVRVLPDPVDHNKMAVEEAGAMHQANVQRVVAVEASVQTITLAESIPHRDGPIQTLEESLPTMESQAPQLQEFAEGIAKLIQQVPVVREATHVIKAGNETRKQAEEVHEQSMRALNQQLETSSVQLEALSTWVTGLVEGLRHQVTVENVKSAIQPILREQTRIVIEDVHEYVERGLRGMHELIQQEGAVMGEHVYSRLIGTQRLFEAVGCYLRSVNPDLASVYKDNATTGSS